jgi:predicted O-methyltransferase YrrM
VRDDVQPELLAAVEQALVEHKAFGNSDYIHEQLELSYKRRLQLIAPDLPSAGKLLQAFGQADAYTRYRIVGNTVIRCTIQHAHTKVETKKSYGLPTAECDRIFEETARHIELGKSGTPFENGATHLDRLGTEPFHPWIWTEDYPDDLFGRSFRFIFNQEYGGCLCTIDRDELAMLMKGEQLLRELLPSLARSALGHAHLVSCFPDVGFWRGKVSSSQIRMGGTIYLNRHILVNPWCVAEHLLHESLHQKFYDFRHGHALLDVEYTRADSPKVVSLWNACELSNANHWDTHRAYAAFHVYVQLALLALVAEQRAPELETTYGTFRGMVDSRKALERAYYLGEKLKELCWEQLGVAGRHLRDWLMSVLDFLRPSPPPKGAYLHLILDLYQREANRVESVLGAGAVAPSGFSRLLTPIAEEEVENARGVLTAIGAKAELTAFDSALTPSKDPELGKHFADVRRLIAKTILGASPDGYGLGSRALDGDPDALVRQMVDRGSERLYLLHTNVPPAVAAAKRRVIDSRFMQSCEDNVGRLLAALSAAVPSGGRILEIGTGVGMGLAWITAGLGAREDVEVVSIEADLRLARAAGGWHWPAYVQLVTDNAADVMGVHGTFSLVFADAAPIKYGHIDAVIRLLRPGGILLVDDFHEGPRTTEVQHAEKVALRRALLGHRQLQAVELEWSSGVLLATMSATSTSGGQIPGIAAGTAVA